MLTENQETTVILYHRHTN